MAAAVAGVCCVTQPSIADDLATVRQRVLDDLIGNDPSVTTVKGYMSSLGSGGKWSDIDYSSTANVGWDPLTHLTRLTAMAEAYSDASSSLYQSASLKADILSAYNYWIAQDPQSSNWFYNEISTPQDLSNVMVLTSGILSSSQITKGLAIVQRAYVARSNTSGTNTGDNRVLRAMVGINRGIIAGDSSITADAFNAIGDTLVTTTGDGIQRDGSFHQHGAQLYNNGYGSDFAGDAVNAVTLGAGTKFDFTDSQNQTLVDYLLDGTQWMVRGTVIDYTASGRDVTRKGQDTSASSLAGQIKALLSANLGYRTAELQAFQTRIKSSNANGVENSSLALSGNKQFYRSDLMVQQRPSYYASVKLSSTRTEQPETGNNEGLKNLYLADGVNLIMPKGNEYDNIMPVWNWRRLPGTTVEQDSRSLKPTADFGTTGTATFAGGVSDGNYGTEAFAYNRFHVQAKKSWFFFDNEFTALGAGINAADSTSEVDTTLNQTLLSGTVSYKTSDSATVKTLALGDSVSPKNLQWVFHNGVGYFFPTPVDNATLSALTKTGTWSSINARYDDTSVSKNVFTLYLNHGQGFTGGSYNYIVVPGMKVGTMDSYLAANPIDVLSNTASVQAVRQTSLDITQAAFYSARSLDLGGGQSIAVSDPSAIMMQRPANALQLTASSPAAAALTLGIDLNAVKFSASGSSWLDGFSKNATIKLGLPDGSDAGDSVGAAITSDGKASPTIKFTTTNSPTTYSYASDANLALPGNTTLYAGSNKTLTFNGVISGSASLTKDGDSALNLTGANTYTGGTTILDGNITVSGDQRAATGGWNIGPNSDGVTTVTFQPNSQLKIAAGNTFNLGAGSPTGTVLQQVFAGGSVNNNGSLTIGRYGNLRVTGAWAQVGDVAINGYGVDTYSPVLAVNGGGSFTYTGSSTIKINPAPVSTAGASLIVGNSDGAGTFTTSQGFEQTVAGAGGDCSVTIRYGSALVLSNDVTKITAGGVHFRIGDGGGTINTNGFNAGLTAALSNAAGTTGGLTKRGGGTLELFAGGTIAGDTTIAAGTLKISNTAGSATGSGNVAVQSGGTLSGGGSISGAVTLAAGATIAPGASVGTITTGAQTWSAGGNYALDIAAVNNTATSQSALKGVSGGADWVKINGALAASASAANPFRINVQGAADSQGSIANWDQTQNYSWTIASASSGVTGFTAGEFAVDSSGFNGGNSSPGSWTVSKSGNDVLLNYSTDTMSANGITSAASTNTAAGAPKVINTTAANAGSIAVSDQTVAEIALHLNGVTDLSQFLKHLQVATGSSAMSVAAIGSNAPDWLQNLGGASDWTLLVTLAAPTTGLNYAWNFQQDGDVTLDRIAINATAVPEPTFLSATLCGAAFLRRRRRSSLSN